MADDSDSAELCSPRRKQQTQRAEKLYNLFLGVRGKEGEVVLRAQ